MNLKTYFCLPLAMMFASVVVAQSPQVAIDLRQGVPPDAHLAVYGKSNPERDYQRRHMADAWQTFQEEKIFERFLAAVTGQVSEAEMEKANSIWKQVQTALEPINGEALLQTEEVVYAQVMYPPFNQQLLLLKLTPSSAGDVQLGVEQLFDLFETWSDGNVKKLAHKMGEIDFVMLSLPNGVPFSPTIARVNDVVVICSNDKLAEQSCQLLLDENAVSKFDDPRLQEALAQLPAAEDAVVFFDGKQLFEKLHGIADFMRQQNRGDNPELDRWSRIVDRIIDEVAILDYEITVEYTDGHQNRVATLGKLLPNIEDKLMYQAVTQSEPFEDWQSWVPADATAYSLNTGINLHVVYERVMSFVREEFPESHEALDRFEAKQQEIDLHLDRDLLQAFSGEVVSITVPVTGSDGAVTQRAVTALRCHDPEKIKELIDRGMEALTALPPVQAQQLKFVECDDLDGFQELEWAFLNMFAARPVIGFHESWMMIASSPEAVAKVIATREGEADAISEAASFQKFELEVSSPIAAISYTDVAAAVHDAADAIDKIGTIAPVFIGMAAANAETKDLKPVQEIVGLLPSVAKVIRKFDFIEEQLTVTRETSNPDTYRRDSVWLIRPIENDVNE